MSAATSEKGIRCHVLTYNIHGLPWCKQYTSHILEWIRHRIDHETRIPILCFQEVFTQAGREAYRSELERLGYTVLIPHDEGVCLFPSGLVTAVDPAKYRILDTAFRPYMYYNYTDIFANKGFFMVHLQDIATGRSFYVANTHTQSDWEASIVFGRVYTTFIRYKQAEQILEHCEMEEYRDPVLVVGDLNQEESLHPYLRSLHPISSLPIKKATFFHTGEDLDHIAWLPLQWAKQGCGFCDIRKRGPQLRLCRIHPLEWSDHAAVEAELWIPPLHTQSV